MTLSDLRKQLAYMDHWDGATKVFVTDCRTGVTETWTGIQASTYMTNRGSFQGDIVDELAHGDDFVEIFLG